MQGYWTQANRKERACADCGNTRFVEDHAAGDVVCAECGLVAQAHIIDERSEWRTFGDKDKESEDPNRVGGPSNPLLDSAALSTMIGRGTRGDGGLAYQLNRMHNRASTQDRALLNAFKEIKGLCQRMDLNDNIRDHAQKLYKMVADSGQGARGRTAQSTHIACIYAACRELNVPRTFKEIQGSVPGVDQKDLSRAFKSIQRLFQERALAGGEQLAAPVSGLTHPVTYVPRFASTLAFGPREKRAAEDAVRAACPDDGMRDRPWDGKNPTSKVGAVIFIISQLNPDPKQRASLEEVARVAGLAAGTIKNTYKDMHPYLRELVPAAFASDEQLAALPHPDRPMPRSAPSAAAAAAAAASAGAGAGTSGVRAES